MRKNENSDNFTEPQRKRERQRDIDDDIERHQELGLQVRPFRCGTQRRRKVWAHVVSFAIETSVRLQERDGERSTRHRSYQHGARTESYRARRCSFKDGERISADRARARRTLRTGSDTAALDQSRGE